MLYALNVHVHLSPSPVADVSCILSLNESETEKRENFGRATAEQITVSFCLCPIRSVNSVLLK
jgi:hypothetical protein